MSAVQVFSPQMQRVVCFVSHQQWSLLGLINFLVSIEGMCSWGNNLPIPHTITVTSMCVLMIT